MLKYFKLDKLSEEAKNYIFNFYPHIKKLYEVNKNLSLKTEDADLIAYLEKNNTEQGLDQFINAIFQAINPTSTMKNSARPIEDGKDFDLSNGYEILKNLFKTTEEKNKEENLHRDTLSEKQSDELTEKLEVKNNEDHFSETNLNKEVNNIYNDNLCHMIPLSDETGISLNIPLYVGKNTTVSVSTVDEGGISGITFLIETKHLHISDPNINTILNEPVFNFANKIFFKLQDLNRFDFNSAYSIKSDTMFTFILPFKKDRSPVFKQIF